MITIDNYELYIVDYYDGTLNKNQTEELFAFLAGHPGLKDEFDEFENISITSEAISFDGKENLKKLVNRSSPLEQQLIAYYENDLSNDEKRLAEKEIAENENAQEELEVIRKTKLLPDYTILFGDKQSLKRGGKVFFMNAGVYQKASIAAAILLLLLSYFIYNSNKNDQQIVDHNNKVKTDSVGTSNENKINNKLELAAGSHPDQSIVNKKGENDNTNKRSAQQISNSIIENQNNLSTNQKSVPVVIGKDSVEHNINETNRSPINEPVAHAIDNNSDRLIDRNVPQEVNFLAGNGNVMVADLATIFSADEMLELGITPNSKQNEGEPIKALSFITQKINSAAQSRNINVSISDDANLKAATYAFNIGNVFSVSHTSAK